MKRVITVFMAFMLPMTLCACDIDAIVSEWEETSYGKGVILADESLIIEVSTEEVTEAKELKEELIATGSTTFDATNVNRKSNIELAGNIINGTILQPGEIFSFNNVVGQRTAERGFLPAGVFVNVGGKIVTTNGIGGGICQTSSTVCMAVLGTSMEIVERNEHSKRVSYTTRDKEAMVNWGTSDFRFKNTYDFPVRIEVLFEIGDTYETITCNIYSMKYE